MADPNVPVDAAATGWVHICAALAPGALLYSGSYRLLGVQVGAAAIVAVYALAVTFLIMAVVNRIVAHRVFRRQEVLGLDLSQHGDAAYDLAGSDLDEDAPQPHRGIAQAAAVQ